MHVEWYVLALRYPSRPLSPAQRRLTAAPPQPSFQVDGEGPLIWGQDRWATVTDMLRGWDATIPDGVRSRL